MDELRWTHCAIITAPTEPGPEKDLRYTVRVYNTLGLTEVHENVVTGRIKWPGFDCLPATVAGQEPAPDVPPHPKPGWPVHWEGQHWWPWIEHEPVPHDCDESAGSPNSAPIVQTFTAEPAPIEPDALPPAPQEPTMHYEARNPDINLALYDEPVELMHPGATGVRWQVDAMDAETWDTGALAVEHTLDGVHWWEPDTSLRVTAPAFRTTALDVRGVIGTRLRVVTLNNSGEKRVSIALVADGGNP